MDLSVLMHRFTELEYASIGFGPRHPTAPNPMLQPNVDAFLAGNPYLKKDQGYVDFLETYSAAAVNWPNQELMIDIYGFTPEITIYLPDPDEPLTFNGSFFRFAESFVKTGPDKRDFVGLSFGFDSTGVQKPGVYRHVYLPGDDWKTLPFVWYKASFLEWLEDLVNKAGRQIV
jgi:hypothetical protein